jgi:hypothetical protein
VVAEVVFVAVAAAFVAVEAAFVPAAAPSARAEAGIVPANSSRTLTEAAFVGVRSFAVAARAGMGSGGAFERARLGRVDRACTIWLAWAAASMSGLGPCARQC